MCKICEEYYKEQFKCVKIDKTSVDMGELYDVFKLEAYMIDSKLQLELNASYSGDVIAQLNIPIKYCPFCGKEITEVTDEEL